MPRSVALDEKLLAAAVRAGKHRSKKEALDAALAAYVRTSRRNGILTLTGRVEYYPDYDHKPLRGRHGRPRYGPGGMPKVSPRTVLRASASPW
jgi:hypothetical protein